MGYKITSRVSCKVVWLRGINCQDSIVFLKNRSKFLKVSCNDSIERTMFWKGWSERWNWTTFAVIEEERRKRMMCSSLQSAAFKKSETPRKVTFFTLPKSESSLLKLEMSRDQLSNERCLTQKRMGSSQIRSPNGGNPNPIGQN